MIDRQLASSSDQYSEGQTGSQPPTPTEISTELEKASSQPPVEDQYIRGGFIVYNRGSIQRMIDS